MEQKIKVALITLSNKSGFLELAEYLQARGVKILSTGGTAKALQDAKIDVIQVSAYTQVEELLDGRVKTLNHKIHAGILSRNDEAKDLEELVKYNILSIDLIICNLYPFEQVVAKQADYAQCVENIDIGGVAAIRAGSKNHKYVTVVTDSSDYDELIQEMDLYDGATSFEFRKKLAYKAFKHCSEYDRNISKWLAKQVENDKQDDDTEELIKDKIVLELNRHKTMRYGENPHQKAGFYVLNNYNLSGLADAVQLNGKALSYNNMADVNSAYRLVKELDLFSCCIIKHSNPCGAASSKSGSIEALKKAWQGDSISAFGSIIAFNNVVDKECAEWLSDKFVEVIVAPEFTSEGLEVFRKKKNLIILEWKNIATDNINRIAINSVNGGFLVQEQEKHDLDVNILKCPTNAIPNVEELSDLSFAWRVCSYVKSNAIVLAKNNQIIGVGAGQMSRLDSAKIAIEKAKLFNFELKGAVCASDAFFPFADGVEILANAGVTSFIQPGGSIRDKEVIACVNTHGGSMLFTGVRTFLH